MSRHLVRETRHSQHTTTSVQHYSQKNRPPLHTFWMQRYERQQKTKQY